MSSAWTTFWIASGAIFIVTLDGTAVVAAYPALRAEFAETSVAWLSWTLNAYTIVYAALLVPAGRLADLHGRRRLFLVGVTLFTLASVLCALSPDIGLLVAARIVQALGAALLTPATLGLLLAAFPTSQRAAVIGMFSAAGALAAAVGPALGSWIIQVGSWRWVFLINLPLGLAGLWLGRRRLIESRSPETGGRIDLFGVILLIVGAGAIALGVVQTENHGWGSAVPWRSVALGALVLIAFVLWARDRPGAALDLQLFADATFRHANLATLSFGIGFSMMFLSGFLVLIDLWGYSQALAGLAITPGPLIVLPVAIVMGRVAGRIGHRPMLVGGALLYAAAQLWLAWRLGPEPDYLGTWLPAQLTAGIAVGLVLPALSGAAVAHLEATRYAVGGSVNNALRQLGGAIGAALAVALVGARDATLTEFVLNYEIIAIIAVVTALLCLPVDTRPRTA